jgi:hypothetical protein
MLSDSSCWSRRSAALLVLFCAQYSGFLRCFCSPCLTRRFALETRCLYVWGAVSETRPIGITKSFVIKNCAAIRWSGNFVLDQLGGGRQAFAVPGTRSGAQRQRVQSRDGPREDLLRPRSRLAALLDARSACSLQQGRLSRPAAVLTGRSES